MDKHTNTTAKILCGAQVIKKDVMSGWFGPDLDKEIIWCGVALGYADARAPINSYRTPRFAVEDFCEFVSTKAAVGGRAKAKL